MESFADSNGSIDRNSTITASDINSSVKNDDFTPHSFLDPVLEIKKSSLDLNQTSVYLIEDSNNSILPEKIDHNHSGKESFLHKFNQLIPGNQNP